MKNSDLAYLLYSYLYRRKIKMVITHIHCSYHTNLFDHDPHIQILSTFAHYFSVARLCLGKKKTLIIYSFIQLF